MAIICPECSEIHFETTSAPAPTHCRKCEADLNQVAGLLPYAAMNDFIPGPIVRTKTGLVRVAIGAGLLFVSCVCGWVGYHRFTSVKETTATVVSKKDARGNVSPSHVRNQATASYSVGGKDFFIYPGVRSLGAKFAVYYDPGNPAVADEQKPWMFFLFSALAFKIGLVVLIRGLFAFGIARAQESDLRKVMSVARV